MKVPTVSFFVEQTVDIPVQGGGGHRGELQGQSSSAFSGAEHQGPQGLLPEHGSSVFVEQNIQVFTVFNSVSC